MHYEWSWELKTLLDLAIYTNTRPLEVKNILESGLKLKK